MSSAYYGNYNRRESIGAGRAPMRIDENGDVVFVEPEPRPIDFIKPKPKRQKEPTPIMLCNEISKIFNNAVRESSEDSIVRGSAREILFHLAHEDGRTQLELAELTHLKPPSISVALRKLETADYVRRETDVMDSRKTRVYLTEKGKQVDEKAQCVIKKYDEKAASGLTKEEMKSLMIMLFKLRENICEDE